MLCGETTTFHVARPFFRPSVTVHTLRGDEMRVLLFGVLAIVSGGNDGWECRERLNGHGLEAMVGLMT